MVRGERASDTVLKCGIIGRLRFKVTECSAYDDARIPSVHTLGQSAWRLFEIPRTGEKRFVSPAEFANLTKADDDDDD